MWEYIIQMRPSNENDLTKKANLGVLEHQQGSGGETAGWCGGVYGGGSSPALNGPYPKHLSHPTLLRGERQRGGLGLENPEIIVASRKRVRREGGSPTDSKQCPRAQQQFEHWRGTQWLLVSLPGCPPYSPSPMEVGKGERGGGSRAEHCRMLKDLWIPCPQARATRSEMFQNNTSFRDILFWSNSAVFGMFQRAFTFIQLGL